MIVTVTVVKTDWEKPEYSLSIDWVYYEAMGYKASYILVGAECSSDSNGIFSSFCSEPIFRRDDTTVSVDFGDTWDPSRYDNPALEIQRRVALVDAAFEAVRESYERSYTVTI